MATKRPALDLAVAATLATTVATGLWLLLGLVRADAYYGELGAPPGAVDLPWHRYVTTGFAHTVVPLFAGGIMLGALEVPLLKGMGRRHFLAEVLSVAPFAALLGLARESFAWTSWGERPSIGPGVTWSHWAAIAFVVLAALIALLVRRTGAFNRFPPRVLATYSLGFTLVFLTVTTIIEAKHEAQDDLWRLSPHLVVTYDAPDSPLVHNETFYFAGRGDGGDYVRPYEDVGGKDSKVLFVPDAVVRGRIFETRSGHG